MRFGVLQVNRFFALLAGTTTLLTTGLAATPATAFTLVDTELVLSVDVSGSIDGLEFDLQRKGYVKAFRDPETISLIEGLDNGIAVTMQYWSVDAYSTLDWFHITDAASSLAFADAILGADRPANEETNIAGALTLATNSLLSNDFEGDHLVIDLSSDGIQNVPNYNPADARDRAVAEGITINGLPILSEVPELDDYFANNVIGGEGAFVEAASDFEDLSRAIKTKIQREVVSSDASESVPEPSSLLGLIGLGLMALVRRSRPTDVS
jgi:hypothetical protein